MSNLKKNKNDVVTVVVITYHSAVTVLETLDSIVNQTYGPENIELIISDDGSKDNTVQVINDWLVQHQTKFHNVKFLENNINGGIPKNCNMAWKAATSDWIKTIAGDDLLTNNALSDLVSFVNSNAGVDCVFGLVKFFPVKNECSYPVKGTFSHYFFELKAKEQFESLLIGNIPLAPGAFLSKKILENVGYADEQFSILEDYPLWLTITRNGFKLHLLNTLVVNYRVGESVSLSNLKSVNLNFNNEVRKCISINSVYTKRTKGWFLLINGKVSYCIDIFVIKALKNKKNKFTELLHHLAPINLLRFIRSKFFGWF